MTVESLKTIANGLIDKVVVNQKQILMTDLHMLAGSGRVKIQTNITKKCPTLQITCNQALFFLAEVGGRKEKVRPIHLFDKSLAKSPESGLLSD